jgi:hypothetical protein
MCNIFCRANNKILNSVFLLPDAKSLKTPGNSNFINVDDSKYLQFVPQMASGSQELYNKTNLCYVLTTLTPNNNNFKLLLHENALPSVIEWPSQPYYKVNGVYLKNPADWSLIPEDTEKYNFETVTPIKAFNPKKNYK